MAAIVLHLRVSTYHRSTRVVVGEEKRNNEGCDAPMTKLGRSMISLRIEKQNVAGTGAPEGLRSTQCEYTDCVVFSKACSAKFSQYSTTDWFSKS